MAAIGRLLILSRASPRKYPCSWPSDAVPWLWVAAGLLCRDLFCAVLRWCPGRVSREGQVVVSFLFLSLCACSGTRTHGSTEERVANELLCGI
jgi:hypothetical protein